MTDCSTCKREVPPPTIIRFCFDCQKVFERHDKWKYKRIRIFSWDKEGRPTFNQAGRIAVVPVHRHCENPDDYVTIEERKKMDAERHTK